MMRGRAVILTLYLLFLALPIYWLVNMSLKTNAEITTSLTLWPRDLTVANYAKIFTDSSWYSGYLHSLQYVILNTIISIALALPAAYAFSRYRFIGDKRAAVLQPLFGDRPVRHAMGRGARPLPV
jgi:glycerol transport system permease protein